MPGGVHHHFVPERLLLHGLLWRGQGANEVGFKFLLIEILTINGNVSGPLPRASSVRLEFAIIRIPWVWKSCRTPRKSRPWSANSRAISALSARLCAKYPQRMRTWTSTVLPICCTTASMSGEGLPEAEAVPAVRTTRITLRRMGTRNGNRFTSKLGTKQQYNSLRKPSNFLSNLEMKVQRVVAWLANYTANILQITRTLVYVYV